MSAINAGWLPVPAASRGSSRDDEAPHGRDDSRRDHRLRHSVVAVPQRQRAIPPGRTGGGAPVMSNPPAGWYPAPDNGTLLRFAKPAPWEL